MTCNGSDIKLEIVHKDQIFHSSFSTLLTRSSLKDVKLVFDDGILHLDKLSTGILFPYLSDDLEKMIGVDITLLLPQFSSEIFRSFLEDVKLNENLINPIQTLYRLYLIIYLAQNF